MDARVGGQIGLELRDIPVERAVEVQIRCSEEEMIRASKRYRFVHVGRPMSKFL